MDIIIKKALQNISFIDGKPSGDPMTWLISDPDLLFNNPNAKEEIITIAAWFSRCADWKLLFIGGYAFNTVKACDQLAVSQALGFVSWEDLNNSYMDMDAITDVSMSENMYDYAIQEQPEMEDFNIWFGKEFENIATEYAALIPTNFIDFLKRDYDDDRDYLVTNQKGIFDNLIELMEEYVSSKLD